MDLQDLTYVYIESSDGFSVANQFQNIWEGGSKEDQNENALRVILRRCRRLKSSNLLAEGPAEDLQDFISELAEYLSKVGLTQNA